MHTKEIVNRGSLSWDERTFTNDSKTNFLSTSFIIIHGPCPGMGLSEKAGVPDPRGLLG